MSELGAISGKLKREVEILRELNNALLIIEIDTLGLHSELEISPEDVSKSQKFMMEFADKLCSVLKHKSPTIDLKPIIHHFRSGMKPVEDWIEDLELLIQQIRNQKISQESLTILEDILSLLDDQFSEDLRRLYSL